MKISFVIPVYHNEGAISKTHEKIKSIFSTELDQHEYEIIFVDDGSTDGSLREILDVRDTDVHVKAVTFTRNFGQMAAMLAGFKEASGDAIINISADLQDPVELIPEMVQKWQAGSEIVICHRSGREDSLFSKLYSWLAYGVLRLALPQIPPGGFDFVLMDRKVMDAFNSIDVRHRFFQGDLLWTGYRTSFIPYVRLKREIGKSQYNFSKKLKNFLDAVLDASNLPIRLISLLGVVTSFLGVLYSASIVFSWMRGETPFAGWAPIMIAILLVGGLIMVMLGVIGEYVWRINEEVRKRPNYVIRDKF
ncbi:glycosyltransferase family 2 protein [Paralcaligenes ureilyticus]|uniref:Dolichol-phosphate mannosyltransferase n=1 Tax=Paralcaligenes ureilyticus TaxID=627131 RepID=A0A4R3M7N5_9BURK|nr:glycosyltransferase family 2 protein [Paralcaligenes ureilyticus]TCT09066.1 dolichol-phosphate mannosyltransferase [Paralcaligenes ureilyticus]